MFGLNINFQRKPKTQVLGMSPASAAADCDLCGYTVTYLHFDSPELRDTVAVGMVVNQYTNRRGVTEYEIKPLDGVSNLSSKWRTMDDLIMVIWNEMAVVA